MEHDGEHTNQNQLHGQNENELCKMLVKRSPWVSAFYMDRFYGIGDRHLQRVIVPVSIRYESELEEIHHNSVDNFSKIALCHYATFA